MSSTLGGAATRWADARVAPGSSGYWTACRSSPKFAAIIAISTGSRTLDMMRWGLVPYWAKDLKIGFSTINAMAETIDTKPVFREAFRRHRCLVPVDNFYGWKKLGSKEKQPYAIALKTGGIMALAGLWENWKSPAEEWVRSSTIITTTPNALCAEIHDRMLVILPPQVWPVWLGEEPADAERLKALRTVSRCGNDCMAGEPARRQREE
jgi:putative SOS response-associated peptidase YedK